MNFHTHSFRFSLGMHSASIIEYPPNELVGLLAKLVTYDDCRIITIKRVINIISILVIKARHTFLTNAKTIYRSEIWIAFCGPTDDAFRYFFLEIRVCYLPSGIFCSIFIGSFESFNFSFINRKMPIPTVTSCWVSRTCGSIKRTRKPVISLTS